MGEQGLPKIAPGSRIGNLRVAEATGERKNRYVVWLCRCDCGGEILLDTRTLQRRTVLDCGCLGSPPVHDMLGRQFGDLTVAAYDGNRGGTYFWRCRCKCGKETVVRQDNLLQGHTKSCGCRQKKVYIENLKLVEGTSVALLEGARRERVICSNSSGYNGVYKNKRSEKWAAQITFKGKTYYLGAFTQIGDAVRARKTAEERMYGAFLNWYYDTYSAAEESDK